MPTPSSLLMPPPPLAMSLIPRMPPLAPNSTTSTKPTSSVAHTLLLQQQQQAHFTSGTTKPTLQRATPALPAASTPTSCLCSYHQAHFLRGTLPAPPAAAIPRVASHRPNPFLPMPPSTRTMKPISKGGVNRFCPAPFFPGHFLSSLGFFTLHSTILQGCVDMQVLACVLSASLARTDPDLWATAASHCSSYSHQHRLVVV